VTAAAPARIAAAPARIAAAIAVAALIAGCGAFAPIGQRSPGGGSARPAPKASVTATATPAYNMSALLDPSSGKFLGVEADGAPASLGPVGTFAAAADRKPNIIGQYIGWNTSFDAQAAAKAWAYGALYYMSWEPYGTTVAAIAAGDSNAYITKFATAVRARGVPVAISFGHEMNGNWYPWGTTGTTPAAFVAAWRLIHGIFTGVGATNVIWVWNPNDIFPMPQITLAPYWPGNAYVNWVGITGYFSPGGPQSFATLFEPTMREIRQFTSEPFLIAETSVQTGPAEVSSMNSLVRGITRHPAVLGFIWFNYDKAGVDWRLQSRPVLRAAFDHDVAGLQLVDPKT
jgi:mannan endo-1,4-beta-mannosidase